MRGSGLLRRKLTFEPYFYGRNFLMNFQYYAPICRDPCSDGAVSISIMP
jgi:hypothetical protein